MYDTSTASTKIELRDAVPNDTPSASTAAEVYEDVVVKEEPAASIDTTDKRSKNYNTRQANSFAAKKTVAQGMMDVALITANANQLRYLIEYQQNSPTFYLIMILIIISLFLQVTPCITRNVL